MIGVFEWEGKRYSYPVIDCYKGSGYIALPDGRTLQVLGWFETMPPQPVDIKNCGYLRGMHPFGTVQAKEVVE